LPSEQRGKGALPLRFRGRQGCLLHNNRCDSGQTHAVKGGPPQKLEQGGQKRKAYDDRGSEERILMKGG